jgi:allophanate hydrolase subunit 1
VSARRDIVEHMTKVQIHFRLQKPLDETLLLRISDAYSRYGIQKVKVDPSMESLTVEYDATRLRPAEVEAALASAGLPVILA